VNFLARQLNDPVRVVRIRRWFYASLVVAVLAEGALVLAQQVLPEMFHSEHEHFWFESIPGWGSLYGFVSCVAIIVVSKFLGKVWLMRREDYYDS
jgi:hypothetical protein